MAVTEGTTNPIDRALDRAVRWAVTDRRTNTVPLDRGEIRSLRRWLGVASLLLGCATVLICAHDMHSAFMAAPAVFTAAAFATGTVAGGAGILGGIRAGRSLLQR